jgi:uncharacterized cupredoxin-like copper-binding protein
LANNLHATRKASALQNKTASVTENSEKSPAISQQTQSVSENARELVQEFNLRELKVNLVKLSDKQVKKLTQKQSSDKFIDSKNHSHASPDVSDVETNQDATQLVISSDGKHMI